MSGSEIALRRTWPQRLVVLMCLGVIGAALVAAWFVWTLYQGLAELPRVEIGREVLQSETPPGLPVNFLMVGTDSARGLDPDDPILIDREVDPEGRSLADTIMLLRLDPNSGSAWVLSIPRDLIVDIPGAQTARINAALLVGGPETLVRTVSENFDVVVNHYVQLDLLGFREVVDVLGGVPVWFPNPARDLGSGLDIDTAGCHVLDGTDALAYVRGRRYEERIGGEWVVTGGDDFRRIERQQDFLVLALDRAIDRGARSPTTLGTLLAAAADSVLLDNSITLAELVDLGEAFSEFDPDNLERLNLELYTVNDADGTYQGEAVIEGANESLFDVFRGAADSVRPGEVAVTVVGHDAARVASTAEALSGDDVGFVLLDQQVVDEVLPETVIVYGPGERADALLLARYIDPVPFVIEDPAGAGVTVVLGEDFRSVLWLFPTPRDSVESVLATAGTPSVVPQLSGPVFDSTTTAPSTTATTSPSDGADTGAETGSGTSTTVPVTTTPAPTTTAGVQGRPPPGETCG